MASNGGKLKTDSMTEDPGSAQSALTNHAERRKSPRTSIRRLAYVNVDPYDNGGVITDISREGLRFHLVNPVEHGGVVRLSLLLGSANELHVIGELVWLDVTRKVGGVRFTALPDGAADQILNWAEASNGFDISDHHRDGKVHAPSGVSEPSAQFKTDRANKNSATPLTQSSGASMPQTGPRPTSPAQVSAEPGTRSAWVPPSLRPPAGAQARVPNLENAQAGQARPWTEPNAAQASKFPPAMPWITHFDPDPPAQDTSFARGLLGGFLLCAMLGFAAWVALDRYGWPKAPSLSGGPSPTVSDPASSNRASEPALPALPSAQIPTSGTNQSETRLPGSEAVSSLVPNSSSAPNEAATPNASLNLSTPANKDAAAPDASAAQSKSAVAPQVAPQARTPSSQAPVAEAPPATTPGLPAVSPANLLQNATKVPASQAPRSADTGETQLMLARQYLDGHVKPRNPTVASQLLWAAVEKGNSAAEMELADLYLRGDGVARNCAQARVLLSVASDKGNPEAMQKLRELNRTGCR